VSRAAILFTLLLLLLLLLRVVARPTRKIGNMSWEILVSEPNGTQHNSSSADIFVVM